MVFRNVLIHQRCFANPETKEKHHNLFSSMYKNQNHIESEEERRSPAITEDDNLQKNSPARRHLTEESVSGVIQTSARLKIRKYLR